MRHRRASTGGRGDGGVWAESRGGVVLRWSAPPLLLNFPTFKEDSPESPSTKFFGRFSGFDFYASSEMAPGEVMLMGATDG